MAETVSWPNSISCSCVWYLLYLVVFFELAGRGSPKGSVKASEKMFFSLCL